jgi:hypothetical protein
LLIAVNRREKQPRDAHALELVDGAHKRQIIVNRAQLSLHVEPSAWLAQRHEFTDSQRCTDVLWWWWR